MSSNGRPSGKNGHRPLDRQNIIRALGTIPQSGNLYPKTLFGDDDELLEGRPKSTPERGRAVHDSCESAAVLRAKLTGVATQYTSFNFNAENLRPADACLEALILSFLHLRKFTFTHPDVYSVLSDIFHLPPIYRPPARQVFKLTKILRLSRSNPELIRPDIATLNPQALRRHKDLPFITMRVIDSLDNLGDRRH